MDDDEFFVPYDALRAYFGDSTSGCVLFTAGLSVWLGVLFYVLYLVTERHFVRALARLANLLRLSPDIAGLTLLALGNGAPDFFTAVFGARTQFDMILGAAVGSGLFILTAVFGLVVWYARSARNPLDGVIAATSACAPIGGGAVVIDDAALPANGRGAADILRPSKAAARCPRLGRRAFLRNVAVYLGALLLVGVLMAMGRVPLWLCLVLPLCYVAYMGYALAEYYVRRRAAASVLNDADVGAGERSPSIVDTEAAAAFAQLPLRERIRTAAAWPEGAGPWVHFRRVWWVLSMVLSAPLALTVLPLDYGRDAPGKTPDATLWLNRLRCIAAPWVAVPFSAVIFAPEDMRGSWRLWLLVASLSASLSAVMLATTRPDGRPRAYALHICASFAVCIAWVYVVCSELVAALVALGATWAVPAGVLGVLVLAWGNSFGDLVANVAVAHGGGYETAVSAVLCGPIQNTLLTLGVAFCLGALAAPDHVLDVRVGTAVYLAYGLLVLTFVLTAAAVVLLYDCRIPRRFGLVLVGVYVLYLPVSLLFLRSE